MLLMQKTLNLFCIKAFVLDLCHEKQHIKGDYHSNSKYWDRQAFANSVDPDEMLQNAASHLGLYCLPYIQQYFRHIDRE